MQDQIVESQDKYVYQNPRPWWWTLWVFIWVWIWRKLIEFSDFVVTGKYEDVMEAKREIECAAG